MNGPSNALLGMIAQGYDPARRESELLNPQNQRNILSREPEERNWLREQRGMKREQFGWARQQEIERIANKPFKSQDETMAWFKGILDFITPENWDELRTVSIRRVEASGADSATVKSMMPEKFPGNEWVNKIKGKAAEKPTLIPKGTMGTMGLGGEIKPLPPGLPTEEEKGQEIYGKYAHDIYGKSYRQLNPEEKKDIDERVNQMKEKPETVPAELKQFEMETGLSSKLRGTKEYQEAINKWRQGKKEAIQITSPFEHGKYAASLRKEFEDLRPVKDYRDLVAKFSVMQEAYDESLTTKNFVASDQAMITLFNKMTDPQSVVRESEYARTPNDLALINKLKGKIEKLVAGGPGLTQEDRKALLTMGKKFFDTYTDIYKNEVRRYRGYAGMAGLDPDYVVETFKPSVRKPSPVSELKEIKKSDSLGIR